MFLHERSKYEELIQGLSNRLKKALPGLDSQLLMAPSSRERMLKTQKNEVIARQSAVLILIFPDQGDAHTIFIQRNIYDGVHSGQIAFPGGRFENSDPDLNFTALREANEEVGIDPNDVKIIGNLTNIYIPPSNYNVLPVVGYMSYKPKFQLQPSEVSAYFTVGLKQLMLPETCQQRNIYLSNGLQIVAPCFVIGDYHIWGATSMILNELIEVLKDIKT